MDDMKGASDELDISRTKKVDCTNAFTTDVVFPTRDDCINWARDVGRNTAIGRRGRKTIVILGCERSEKYRSYKNSLPTKATGTRKCGCPFRLRARPLTKGEGWILKVVCGLHNDDLAATLVGYPYVDRLSVEEKALVAEMTKNTVKPRTIMLTLQDHDPKSCTTMKQVLM